MTNKNILSGLHPPEVECTSMHLVDSQTGCGPKFDFMKLKKNSWVNSWLVKSPYYVQKRGKHMIPCLSTPV